MTEIKAFWILYPLPHELRVVPVWSVGTGTASLGERQILPFSLLRGLFLQTQFSYTHAVSIPPFLEDANLWGLLCAAQSSLVICSVHSSLLGLPRRSTLFPQLSPQGNFWVTLHDSEIFQSSKLGQSRVSLCFVFPFLVSDVLSFDNHCFMPFLPVGCFAVVVC